MMRTLEAAAALRVPLRLVLSVCVTQAAMRTCRRIMSGRSDGQRGRLATVTLPQTQAPWYLVQQRPEPSNLCFISSDAVWASPFVGD